MSGEHVADALGLQAPRPAATEHHATYNCDQGVETGNSEEREQLICHDERNQNCSQQREPAGRNDDAEQTTPESDAMAPSEDGNTDKGREQCNNDARISYVDANASRVGWLRVEKECAAGQQEDSREGHQEQGGPRAGHD